MTTHRAVVDALAGASARGDSVVLATVVRVTGSSYGGVGARMVVHVDGSTVGVVSGGCLETDLAEQAIKVHEARRARVVTYDTRADDDAAWGLGLGCNGLIDVLLEPLSAVQAGAVGDLLNRGLRAHQPSILATVIDSRVRGKGGASIGAHSLFFNGTRETAGDWGNGSSLEFAATQIDDALKSGRRGLVVDHETIEIALEVIAPAVRLVICGSGPDAVPVVRFASQLGWDVTIVDHRPIEHAPVERFQGARVVECARAVDLEKSVSLEPRTAAVVMSHHYARDLEYVEALLASDVAYIGILGPRARTERMFAELATRAPVAAKPSRCSVFGPVGLDLGGDGPDAIALAIIAEVSAVTSERTVGHLRDRDAPLHEPGPGSARVSSA